MSRTYQTILGLSIGGDTPTWEGEATVSYTVAWGRHAVMYLRNGDPGYPAEPDEITDLTVTHLDGEPVAHREYGKHEAETLQGHIEANDALLDQLIQDAREDEVAAFEDAMERRADERAEWGMQ